MSQRGGTWIQRWRVPLGFLCGAAFIFFARPTPKAFAIGASVSLLGLALRAWAAGHIRKNAQLATSGPYAFTRNPLYLDCFGQVGPGPAVCRAVSWHLFTGDARRSEDNGRALWQRIRNVPAGRTAF